MFTVSGLTPFSNTSSQIPDLHYPLTLSTGGTTKKEFSRYFTSSFSVLRFDTGWDMFCYVFLAFSLSFDEGLHPCSE